MCCTGAVGEAAEPPKWIKPPLTCVADEAPAGDDWLQALHAPLDVEDPDTVLGPTRRPLVGVTTAHGVGVPVHESWNG